MALLFPCFTVAVVSTCCKYLVLIFWNAFPYIWRQTDHSVIIEFSLSVYLICWLNCKRVFFHAALLEVAISSFLEMLNHMVVLMRKMNASINDWIISLWDVCSLSGSKGLQTVCFVHNPATAMIFFKNLSAYRFSSGGYYHCAWSLSQILLLQTKYFGVNITHQINQSLKLLRYDKSITFIQQFNLESFFLDYIIYLN